jgi:Circularly permutated YpsA SLOG family
MPHGFQTEDGKRPEFAELYGATTTASATYPPRTRKNVEDSDATLWFGAIDTPGAMATFAACHETRKPFLEIAPDEGMKPSDVAVWIVEHGVKVLNVAGNRESKSPGVRERVEAFLGRCFADLGSNACRAASEGQLA